MRLGEKQFIHIKSSSKSKIKGTLFVLLLVFFVFGSLIYALLIMRPAFMSLATARARAIAIETINESVLNSFDEEKAKYENIAVFEYKEDGSIGALKSDLAGISRLKSELNLDVMSELKALDRTRLCIPMGSLTGNDLLAGVGPDLSFDIKPYGTAECDIITDFTEMGINQTKLDVTICVRADLSVLAPTVSKKCRVETTVPVISTVIVGSVPDTYTNIDRDGYAFEEDALDLIK
ncbi:MAG: sporulation protein YunB [Clostridia bacterium]|nr:sporulation protein YunB [Clostridia bacterium]